MIEVAPHTGDAREVDCALDAKASKRAQDAAIDRGESIECCRHRTKDLLHVSGGGGWRGGEPYD